MELPFGNNPYARKPTPTASAHINVAPPLESVVQKDPPPTHTQRPRKRGQVTIVDSLKGDAAKKQKNQTGNLSKATIIF